ncbi:hypothetical protein MPH_10085 [Macrophomina phaseolina MS6]|uniref:Uncharacterized protein n=1 Tax=Macrophomina phaseolina (strain MS6) TaxID=1126212 RepID=K2RIX1_MACPH|nr:hypothetical protein MPH_10085 [Macrophomina phaseolina MS6]
MARPLPGQALPPRSQHLFLGPRTLLPRIRRAMPMRYGCSIITSLGSTKALPLSHQPMMLFASRHRRWACRIHLSFTLSTSLPLWTLHAFSPGKTAALSLIGGALLSSRFDRSYCNVTSTRRTKLPRCLHCGRLCMHECVCSGLPSRGISSFQRAWPSQMALSIEGIANSG